MGDLNLRRRGGSLADHGFNTPPKCADLFFNEEAFYTPAVNRPTNPARRSLPNTNIGSFNGDFLGDFLPPTRVFTPTLEVLSGNPVVDEWFRNLITSRKRVAAFWSSVCFGLIYLVALLTLQFSPWSPISSVSNICASVLSTNMWILLFVVTGVFFCVGYAVIFLLATVEQSKHVSLFQKESWICLFLLVAFNLGAFAIALGWFFDQTLLYHSSVFYTIFFLGTVASSAKTVFDYDYRLVFSGSSNHRKFTLSLDELLSFQNFDFVEKSIVDGFRVGAISTVSAICFTFIMVDFSSLWFSINLSGHFALLCVFSSQFLAGRLLNRLCRQIVMNAISFEFPSAYVVANPTPEQQRNIVAALSSDEPLLKLFAVNDVRKLCRLDMKVRRASVFALTQPANNPKNWISLRTACLEIVTNMKNRVDEACSQMKGEERGLDDSGHKEELDRDVLMMPPKARKRLGSDFAMRHHTALRDQKPFSSTIDSIKKFLHLSYSSTLVSSYDIDLICYATEGLSQLATYSHTEDRYGVVQKDLAILVHAFVQLYASIDKYFREKAFITTESASDDSGLYLIMDSAANAVIRLSKKFSAHLGSFGLSNPELGVYESLVTRSNAF